VTLPLVDGREAHPASFDVAMEQWRRPRYLALQSAGKLERGEVWLRYSSSNDRP
jgi:hypothetical protein